MGKPNQKIDVSDVQFSNFDKALFGTLFAMSKVGNFFLSRFKQFLFLFFVSRVMLMKKSHFS